MKKTILLLSVILLSSCKEDPCDLKNECYDDLQEVYDQCVDEVQNFEICYIDEEFAKCEARAYAMQSSCEKGCDDKYSQYYSCLSKYWLYVSTCDRAPDEVTGLCPCLDYKRYEYEACELLLL